MKGEFSAYLQNILHKLTYLVELSGIVYKVTRNAAHRASEQRKHKIWLLHQKTRQLLFRTFPMTGCPAHPCEEVGERLKVD